MFRNKESQKFLASLFAAVYLFVALFSQSFHEHGSAEAFKNFHFTKADKTFTTASEVAPYEDCLSCHILHEGKYITAERFSFSSFLTEEFPVQLYVGADSIEVFTLFNFQLRGPPALFI